MRTRIAFAASLAVALMAVPAFAKDKTAWDVAKASLPKGPNLVVGFDVGKITATETFKKAVTAGLAQEQEAQAVITMLHDSCSIDIFTVVSQAVLAMNIDTQEGVIFLQLNGVDEKKLTDCGKAVATKMSKTLTAKKKGNITEYTMSGEADKIYVGWPSKNVMAITLDAKNKGQVQKLIGGKGKLLKDAVAKKALSAVNAGTLIWGAVFGGKDLATAKISMAYGHGDLSGGNVTGEVHCFFTDAKMAGQIAGQAKDEISKEAAQMPPAVGKILKSISVTSKDAELIITGSATEADLGAAFQAMTGGGGGQKPPTPPPPPKKK